MIELPNLRFPYGRPAKPAQKWLRKGLTSLYTAQTRMINLCDVANSGSLSAPTTAQVGTFTPRYGPGLKMANTSDYGTIPVLAVKEYTMIVVVSEAADGSIGQLLDDDDGYTRAFQFRLAAAGGAANFIVFNTAAGAFTASTASIGAERHDAGVVIAARVLGNEAKVWATGVTPGTATVTGTVQTRAATMRLGQRKGGAPGFTGRFHMVADFPIPLPESDILYLLDNPQDMFEPISIPVWKAAAVGGFKPYWALQRSRLLGAGYLH